MRELRLQRPRRARRITLVALVDLVIILLIFFMLRTNFLQPRQVAVGAATQSAAGAPPPATPFEIELHSDGSTWVAGQRVADPGLRAAVRTHLKGDDDHAIVAVDEGVRLQRAIVVVDLLREIGVRGIDLRRALQFD